MADNSLQLSGIYTITSPSGNQYVGSASNFITRWRGHLSDLKKNIHANSPLQKAFLKYGLGGLKFERLIICSKKDLLFYEQRALDVLKPAYNICKIAGNCIGVKHSLKAKLRISAAEKSRIMPAETIAKAAEANKGKKRDKDLVERIAAKSRGLFRSEETKTKLSIAAKLRWAKKEERDKQAKRSSGKKPTQETINKLRQAALNQWAAYKLRSINFVG